MNWYKKSQNIVIPQQVLDLDPQPIDDYTQFRRYVWGSEEEIRREIQNGVKMNHGHDALPSNWYYLHVGGEEWVAILSRDYGRSGPVCELTFSNLPEGFYYIDDVDIAIRENATDDSNILISPFPVIPKQCVEITKVLDTEEVTKDYPEYAGYNYDEEGSLGAEGF